MNSLRVTSSENQLTSLLQEEKKTRYEVLDENLKRVHLQLNREFFRSTFLKHGLVYKYYPSALGVAGHAHLKIEHHECFAACGKMERTKSKEASRVAHLAFHLNITPEELVSLNRIMEEPPEEGKEIAFNSCAGSSADLLRTYTKINIPEPFAVSPALSAMYLQLQKRLGNPRIQKIEYVGYNEIYTSIHDASTALLESGVLAGGAIALMLRDKSTAQYLSTVMLVLLAINVITTLLLIRFHRG